MKIGHHRKFAWDGVALGVSIGCLVHCVGMPVLLALMPALGGVIGLPEWLHLAAFSMAVPASALAMRTGYRRHGRALPALLGAKGLLLLGLGLLSGASFATETGLTVCGSVLLVVAHIRNWQLRNRSPAPLEAR